MRGHVWSKVLKVQELQKENPGVYEVS